MLKITLHLPDRKTVTRYFSASHSINTLHSQFQKALVEYTEKNKHNFFGIVGFDTIPFNYTLTEILSAGKGTFQTIIDK